MSVTIPLTEPVMAHGEELVALTLRAPTGRDFRLCGAPFRLKPDADGNVEVIPDTGNIAKMVVALAGIPLSSVDALSAQDWSAVETAVLGFSAPATAPAS